MALTLGELADKVGGKVVGDRQTTISCVATLQNAKPSSIAFLANRSYRKYLVDTKASAVILSREDADLCPVDAIVTESPYLAYARIAALLNPDAPVEPGIHPTAVVSENARVDPTAWVGPQVVIEDRADIGANVFVGPGCVIGQGAQIGAATRLVANVTICHHCVIGQRVIIHPGVVIGSDGFGIANDDGVWVKVPQLGIVRIEDDVEIGANTSIDRGALDDTIIGEGAKLDNQIQIAHNVRVGAHTAIAGCVGIAGSATIGAHCALGGGVGVVGHLHIADHVQVTGMSMVTRSIEKPGVYSSGTPLQPNDLWHKNFARFRHLDELARRIRALEKKIGQD